MSLAIILSGTSIALAIIFCGTYLIATKSCKHKYVIKFERTCTRGDDEEWQNQICQCEKCGKLKIYKKF